jgi:glycosyltransferase involved in cell wall biosynthesis
MRVVWLAPYPPDALVQPDELSNGRWYHPSPWLVALADALVEDHGVELTIVTLSRAVNSDLAGRTRGRDYAVLHSSNGYVKLLSGYRRDTSRLLRALEGLAPDVVHAHGTEQEYGIAAARCGRPSVLTIQGFMRSMRGLNPSLLTYRGWSYRALARHEAFAIRQVDVVIAHNRYAEDYVHGIASDAAVRRIPNPVAPEFLRPGHAEPAGNPLVLFVGSLRPEKGVYVLLEAVADMADGGASLDLALVGPGALGDVSDRVQRLLTDGIGGVSVEITGSVSQSEVADQMRRASAVVLPSLAENAPTVVMEAMAVGAPVVASRTGGIPDMIADGVDGVLVEPGDVESLREGLSRVLDSRDLRRRLSEKARERAHAAYRPDIVAARTVGLYEEVVAACRANPSR